MVPPRVDPDVLETLAQRYDILSALEAGPRHKRDLTDALECSRSTVDRAIRELERFDLVARGADGFALTASGRLALAEYRRCLGALESIDETSHLLEYVPREAPLSVAMLDGATVHEPSSHAPTEPLEEITQLLDGAERFRALAAAERLPQFRTLLYEGTVEGTLDAEAVFTEDLASFLLANRPAPIRDVMVDGDFQMYALPSLPYELGIIDRPSCSRAFLVITTDDGDTRAVIRNDTADALAWAREVYRRYRATARRLSPPSADDPAE